MNSISNNKTANRKLLSGNEAIALGAFRAGLKVATAYPGTPSTEILENISRFADVYTEWSTNEKVALEVAMGAAYSGVRALACMKHVGLNVAADPLMSVSMTGIRGGLVIVSADDPGMHSSQNEQDNRHYARLAKIPAIEPFDSQSAYDYTRLAYQLSEEFDTPVLLRTTTRISHSKSVVRADDDQPRPVTPAQFDYNAPKYVMLPAYARMRHISLEQRLARLEEYAATSPLNQIIRGEGGLGIVASGIAYQYAREVFPQASILRLGMTYPLSQKLVRQFAAGVDRLIVIEELDPFIEDIIKSMGIEVAGKAFIPATGELSPEIVRQASAQWGLAVPEEQTIKCQSAELPGRPPSLCPGCPHRGLFFELSRLDRRFKAGNSNDRGLVITGDIGCYTLGAYPPLNSMDTCACMGASIGQAIGMEKAGIDKKLLAVIGDSTFMHSGITPLVNAVYNQSHITLVILDNMTTAMTGHQGHPATGVAASGKQTQAVDIEQLVRGLGVERVEVLDAFDVMSIRQALKKALGSNQLSVLIVRGICAPLRRFKKTSLAVDKRKCTRCMTCLRLACPAIQLNNGEVTIDRALCIGSDCGLCEQICPAGAISTAAGMEKQA